MIGLSRSIEIRDIARIALSTSLIIIGAFFTIPLGPVPISMQTFFVFIISFLLKEKAYISVALYIFMGVFGFGIFAGGNGGVTSIFLPSFGFLIGMFVASIYAGKKFSLIAKADFKQSFIVLLKANFLIYVIGLVYMGLLLNLYFQKNLSISYILINGMLIFLPGDFIKLFVASKLISSKKIIGL